MFKINIMVCSSVLTHWAADGVMILKSSGRRFCKNSTISHFTCYHSNEISV